jgi:hypothetical protein
MTNYSMINPSGTREVERLRAEEGQVENAASVKV